MLLALLLLLSLVAVFFWSLLFLVSTLSLIEEGEVVKGGNDLAVHTYILRSRCRAPTATHAVVAPAAEAGPVPAATPCRSAAATATTATVTAAAAAAAIAAAAAAAAAIAAAAAAAAAAIAGERS